MLIIRSYINRINWGYQYLKPPSLSYLFSFSNRRMYCSEFKSESEKRIEKIDLKKEHSAIVYLGSQKIYIPSEKQKSLWEKKMENINPSQTYIHGLSTKEEEQRLNHQSEGSVRFLWNHSNLQELLKNHNDKPFLEIGCGVGSQTPQLLSQLPKNIRLTCIDIDENQLEKAKQQLKKHPKYLGNVSFKAQDVTKINWDKNSLSGAYISWVLEHLGNDHAKKLINKLHKAIQKGGIILVNEIVMEPISGMVVLDQKNEFPPITKFFLETIIQYQKKLGGNANYGMEQNMRQTFEDVGFHKVIFKRIVMEYPESELSNSKRAALEMFNGIKTNLIKEGLFSEKLYKTLVEEINHATFISWSSGQILAIV